jgi:MFS superfamily sulfate permease-like transporter
MVYPTELALGLFFIGVLIGVLISLLLLIAAVSRSPVRRMGLDTKNDVYVSLDSHPDAVTPAGVMIVAIDGPLFFADADPFRQSLLAMVAESTPHAIVMDLGVSVTTDLDGADILARLAEELGRQNVKLALARVNDNVLVLLRKAGTIAAIGEENVYESVRGAVAAVQQTGVIPNEAADSRN